MRDILFWTNLKGDLQHYSFIFRNLDPLEMELRNKARYKLGTMLYLEIQKGGDAMKASDFQQDIIGTAYLTKIIMKTTKGCSKLSSKTPSLLIAGSEELNSEGGKYIGSRLLRACEYNPQGILSSYIKKLMKKWSSGFHLVMKSSPIFTDYKPIMAIG